MKKDIVKKINFLKARRHQDALRIKGKYLFANFYEPDVWKNVEKGNYAIIAQKINAAQTVEQLARALLDSELLKKVYGAYKSAKASGLYV